jgi:hypothetical protein
MHLSIISVLFALALPFVNAEDPKPLEIEYTHKIGCDRKTQKGDRIDVHYKGTLTNGISYQQFP